MPTATGEKLYPFIKDPNAIRTFGINWATVLDGLGFSASIWAVVSGTVIIDSSTTSTTYALAKLSGGTVGEKCVLRNRITRSDGEIDDRTIYVKIKEK